MNKAYKWIVGAICALALVTSTFAAENTVATTKAPVQTSQSAGSLFNSGELGLSLASGYDLGTAGTIKGPSAFNHPYTLNFNAGAFWFPFRNLGFEANVPFYQSKGVSVDEVQAGIVLRLPLAKETPIFRNISPYLGVDAVYNWNADANWAYIAKAGTEVRLNKKWGVFVEGQYRNNEVQKDSLKSGNVSLNGGLRLVF